MRGGIDVLAALRILGALFALSLPLALPLPAHAAEKYAALVMDAESGELIFEHAPDALRHPASLTKMMTIYMTFEALRSGALQRDQHLLVSKDAASRPATRLGVKPHQTITVDQAVKALVTKSANDVAVVLAEALGGNEDRFATLMTSRARQLGMSNTVFKNASGLHDPQQVTTARDMALLSRALIVHFPDDYHRYFNIRSFVFYGRTVRGHNAVNDAYSGADGLKTGYTRPSGYNLATSAVRHGKRLIGVVLGGPSARWRDRHMVALLNQGFLSVGVAPPALPAGWRDASLTPPRESRSAAAPTPVKTAKANKAAKKTKPSLSVALNPIPEANAAESDVFAAAEAAPRGKPREKTGKKATPGEAITGGPWGVQVGAYALQALARHHALLALAALNAEKPTTAAKPAVMAVRTGEKTLFRARIIGFSRDGAATACRRLKGVTGECMVVSPDQIQSLAQANF